jgi:hypothetical protein
MASKIKYFSTQKIFAKTVFFAKINDFRNVGVEVGGGEWLWEKLVTVLTAEL